MSDYPATPSYGMGCGAQDQSQYLQPSYPNPYSQQDDGRMGQAGMPSSYDASSYGYYGVTPSFGAAIPVPQPLYPGAGLDQIAQPPYAPAHPVPQYGGYANGAHQNSQYYPASTQAQSSYQPATRPYDEGEVSESEFESAATMEPGRSKSAYGSNQYGTSNGTNYLENAQRSAYPGGQDENSQPAYQSSNKYKQPSRDSPHMRSQQNDTYSPYALPKAIDNRTQVKANQTYDSYTPSNTGAQGNGAPKNQYGWLQERATNSPKASSYTNGHHLPTNPEPAKQDPAPSAASTLTHLANKSSSTVLETAREKARDAILDLLSYEIRFQTIIDEGYDKEIVSGLFNDLKMPIVSKPANGNGGHSENQSISIRDARAENELPTSVKPANQIQQNGKGQFTTLSTLPNGSTTGTSAAAGAKATGLSDKEKTLKSKMEALRKSREERAQKVAAKSSTKSPTTATPSTTLPAIPVTPAAAPAENKAILSNTTTLPLAQPPPSRPSIPVQSPVQFTSTQQVSMIPGLFLSSTAASPVPSTNIQAPLPSQSNQRKRPVAADFDSHVAAPLKRPFGQSRDDRPLVIDVSDEEMDSDDEDVAMDLESQADPDSPVQGSRNPSNQRSSSMQLPPKPFTPPFNPSAPGTPSVSNATIGRPEDLQRKESEIELLKKKIAEAEARKKAKQTPSGTRTPRAVDTATDAKEAPAVDTTMATKIEASKEIEHLLNVAADQATLDQQKLADTQAAEREKVAELKNSEREKKRLLREQITNELSLFDVEAQQNRAKLEQIRAEMAKAEADAVRSERARRERAEALERLGQEADDEIQAQKAKLQDLTNAELAGNDDQSHVPTSIPIEEAVTQVSLPKVESSPASTTVPIQNHSQPATPPAAVAVNGQGQHQLPTRSSQSQDTVVVSRVEQPTPDEPPRSNSREDASTDQALEAALQEAVRAEADFHELEKGDADVDMEASFAPNPTQLAPESSHSAGEEPEEERGSPMYSPVLNRAIPDVPDAESDSYEPPEATPPVDAPSVDSPPFSPAPPDNISASANIDDSMQMFDAPEDSKPSVKGNFPRLIQDTLPSVPSFKPYESPLKLFRAFRFHPDYKQQVSGGLKSLTYSHRINPAMEFCRFELAGGICNDPTCDLQHFRDIKLPDDHVLTALGSPEEFSAEQREKFCEGLRGVLTDLRARKIKEFDIIAAEIIAHRAKFLGNGSVLNLDDSIV